MSYELSFAEDFFTGCFVIDENDIRTLYPITTRPQSVIQALVSLEKLRPSYFRSMVKDVLGYSLTEGQPVDETVFWDLLEKIRAYNTCDDLTPPIEVYVDEHYSVTVYEDREEEVA